MVTTRDCVREYLIAGIFNTVTGYNDRSIQYQGFVDKKMVFGLYNEDGDHDGETTDLEAALDYIGLERDCSYNPVYRAYKALVECPEGEEAIAIEEAIGYLGEALR